MNYARQSWTAIRCVGQPTGPRPGFGVGLLAVFLIAGPIAAIGAGHWAYHAGITAARMPAAPTHRVKPDALQPAAAGSLASARRWSMCCSMVRSAARRGGGACGCPAANSGARTQGPHDGLTGLVVALSRPA
jgi:hypothetical protein